MGLARVNQGYGHPIHIAIYCLFSFYIYGKHSFPLVRNFQRNVNLEKGMAEKSSRRAECVLFAIIIIRKDKETYLFDDTSSIANNSFHFLNFTSGFPGFLSYLFFFFFLIQ